MNALLWNPSSQDISAVLKTAGSIDLNTLSMFSLSNSTEVTFLFLFWGLIVTGYSIKCILRIRVSTFLKTYVCITSIFCLPSPLWFFFGFVFLLLHLVVAYPVIIPWLRSDSCAPDEPCTTPYLEIEGWLSVLCFVISFHIFDYPWVICIAVAGL
jgi:hypothetical protein